MTSTPNRAPPKKPFMGPLARPIIYDANRDALLLKMVEKWPLLFDHYGLTTPAECDGVAEAYSSVYILALRLAVDFVPGFQMAHRPGARKRDLAYCVTLLADMQKVMDEQKCSVALAAKRLVKMVRPLKPEYKRRWGGKKWKTVEKQFYAAARDPRVWEFLFHIRNPPPELGR